MTMVPASLPPFSSVLKRAPYRKRMWPISIVTTSTQRVIDGLVCGRSVEAKCDYMFNEKCSFTCLRTQ